MTVAVNGDLANKSRRGIVVAARVGYAAKGLVYAVVGMLALLAALGESGGRLTDSKGALREIGEQPLGVSLLWATAVGLLCYAAWKGVCAVLDPEHAGNDGKGIAKRVIYAITCIVHLLLAYSAAELAHGSATSGGTTRSSVSKALSLPLGSVLVAIVGAVFIGFGLSQVYKAIKGKVGEQYASAPLGPTLRPLVRKVARVGVFARGLVFPVIGISLITAAWRDNAREAEGFGEALGQLARQPFGTWLLGFVASGLMAYAIHLFFVARYGHLPEPR
jgi:hypothetical protein